MDELLYCCIAAAGASAALAGLVFVALSVNIGRIVQYPHLPSRAGATMATLILLLICSMATLIHQRIAALGVEILAFALCVWLLHLWSARQTIAAQLKLKRPPFEGVFAIAGGQIQLLPLLVGGIMLAAGHDSGFYWIAAGAIAIFIFSMLNAWVLLVEILR